MANWSSALCAFILACGIASDSWADDPLSSGTGFAVTADGWLMTNAHVVHGCERVEVKGKGVAADPRVDEANDPALIRIPSGDSLTPIVFRKALVRHMSLPASSGISAGSGTSNSAWFGSAQMDH